MNSYAPIVVFAYNRARLLRNLLQSLRENRFAEQSELYIYIDGAKDADDQKKVSEVIAVAQSTDVFLKTTVRVALKHNGLAMSIRDGVSEVLKTFGVAIVLEDDLYVSRQFIAVMNTMLQTFEKDGRIMQVSGFGSKLSYRIGETQEYYLCGRAQSWGWATWIDRWNTIDWNIVDYQDFLKNKTLKKNFAALGSDLMRSLQKYKNGEMDVWLIAYIYNMYRKKMYAVCPRHSLVRNDGFGADASNCRNYNRYAIDFNENVEYNVPTDIQYDKKIEQNALRFWSVRYRIYGKIMTIVDKLCGRSI